LDTSIMLLGMISFVMVLFYLTNWPDDDIRFYSLQITSTTISIFCAVLLFTGFNQLICTLATKDNGIQMCFLHFAHCFAYLTLMHIGTAVESGVMWEREGGEALVPEEKWVYADALQWNNDEPVEIERVGTIRAEARGDRDAKRSVIEVSEISGGPTMEVPVQKKRHTYMRRRRRTKALAMLFAHMAGFAAIFSGTSLMRVCVDPDSSNEAWSKIVVWLPIVFNQLVVQAAFWLSQWVRHRQVQMRWEQIRSRQTSNEVTMKKEQEGLQMVEDLMKEEVVESENDVSSLSLSYLAVHVMRFSLTGHLPDEQAEEPEGWRPELVGHALALYGLGVLVGLLACGQAFAMQKYKCATKHQNPVAARMLNTVLNATGMCSAWCVLWATKWTFKWWCVENLVKPHPILEKVVIAFVLTAFASVMVFIVDKVDDHLEAREPENAGLDDGKDADSEAKAHLVPKGDEPQAQDQEETAKEIVRIIVNSLGILVGFSWEHCFDGGVETVSEKSAGEGASSSPSPMRLIVQLFMGIMVCMLVLPAWRRHILQKVMLMEEMLHPDPEKHDTLRGRTCSQAELVGDPARKS